MHDILRNIARTYYKQYVSYFVTVCTKQNYSKSDQLLQRIDEVEKGLNIRRADDYLKYWIYLGKEVMNVFVTYDKLY